MGLRNLLYSTFLSGVLAFNGCNKDSPVEPVNHAPVIERIVSNPQEPYTEEEVSLECVASDEDDDNLIYDWRCDKGYFSTVDERIVSWYSPENVGVSHITAKVDDGKMGTDSHSLDLRVVSRFDTILVSEDAYVDLHRGPDWNSQSDYYGHRFLGLYLDQRDFGYIALVEPYLKFNFDIAQRRVRSAKLRLTIETSNYPGSDLRCDIYGVIGSWSENTLRWNNKPSYDLTLIRSFTMPGQSDYPNPETFYTGNLRDLIEPLTGNGIVIHPLELYIYNSLFSKEGAQEEGNINYAPALILEYE